MNQIELKEQLAQKCDIYYEAKPVRKRGVNKILALLAEGVGQDFTDFKDEVAQAKVDSAALKGKMNAITNTDILDKFNPALDDDMKDFINGHLPGLSDTQKLDAAVIVQLVKRE